MNKLVLAVLAVFLVTLTACGGGSMASTNPPPPPPPPPPTVSATVTVNSPTGGTSPFDVAMSTSFQPAEWDYQFFTNFPSATTPLGAWFRITFGYKGSRMACRRAPRERAQPPGIS